MHFSCFSHSVAFCHSLALLGMHQQRSNFLAKCLLVVDEQQGMLGEKITPIGQIELIVLK